MNYYYIKRIFDQERFFINMDVYESVFRAIDIWLKDITIRENQIKIIKRKLRRNKLKAKPKHGTFSRKNNFTTLLRIVIVYNRLSVSKILPPNGHQLRINSHLKIYDNKMHFKWNTEMIQIDMFINKVEYGRVI